MSRKRVIVEIENLEQAKKVEETVRTGYCDAAAENLVAWIAVEEDLAASYEKLSLKYSSQELKDAMLQLSSESKNTVNQLHEFLKAVEKFGAARQEKERLIESLIHKAQTSI